MKAEVNRKCYISFFRLNGGDSLDYLSFIYFIFRIGPGAGVGTAAPRLRTYDLTLVRAGGGGNAPP